MDFKGRAFARVGNEASADRIWTRFQEIDQPSRAMAIPFYGYGECLPNHSNYVELDKEKCDAWGIPVLKIHSSWGENELAMRRDMAITPRKCSPPRCARHSALCRKRATRLCDPRDGHGSHGPRSKNLGAQCVQPVTRHQKSFHHRRRSYDLIACVNPSLTYMALTARACDYAVQQLKRGRALMTTRRRITDPSSAELAAAILPRLSGGQKR